MVGAAPYILFISISGICHFLVDSLRMALNRRGLNIFTLQSNPVWVVRDNSGQLKACHKSYIDGAQREAFINIEVDIHRDSELAELQRDLLAVLDDVQTVVDDFDPMRLRVGELIEELTDHGRSCARGQ